MLQTDQTQKEYVSFARLSMSLSILGICCSTISDTGNLKQINIDIDMLHRRMPYKQLWSIRNIESEK